jgi:hypothetical protein
MTKFLMFLSLFALLSCDPPRSRSAKYGFFNNSLSTSTPTNPSGGATTIVIAPTNGTTTVPTNNPIPLELRHCSFAMDGRNGFQHSANHVGAYTLCQPRNNGAAVGNNVYLQMKTPINQGQLCLIPITINSQGRSTFIGEPKCLMVTDPMQVYNISFSINRQGLSGATLRGAMIMKDVSLYFPAPFNQYLMNVDAYLWCMDYVDRTGDTSYCQSYDSVGQFVEHRF